MKFYTAYGHPSKTIQTSAAFTDRLHMKNIRPIFCRTWVWAAIFLFQVLNVNAQSLRDELKRDYSTEGWKPSRMESVPNRQVSEELLRMTPPEFRNHPEFGQLPYNAPCQDCAELVHKRTANERWFVKNGAKGDQISIQKSHFPLHFQNAQGQLVTIDPTLVPNANGGFETRSMPMSVEIFGGVVTLKGTKAISFEPAGFTYPTSTNSETIGRTNDGSLVSNCVGCEQQYVIKNDKGLTIYQKALKTGGVKSTYVIEKPLNNLFKYSLATMEETFSLDGGLKIIPSPNAKPVSFGYSVNTVNAIDGDLYVVDANSTPLYTIGKPVVYDAKGYKINACYTFEQKGNAGFLKIVIVSGDLINAAYPVIIDPTVTCGPGSCPNNAIDMAAQFNQRIPSCPSPTFSPSEDITFNNIPALYRVQSATYSGGFEGSGLSSDPNSCNNIWEGKASFHFIAACGSEVVHTPSAANAAAALADVNGAQTQFKSCAAPATAEDVVYQFTNTSTTLVDCISSPQCAPFNATFNFGITRNCNTGSGCNDTEVYATACNTISMTLNLIFDPTAVNPTAFNVSGPTSVCEGASATIALSGSEAGVTYTLFKNGVQEGSTVAGTGAALNFVATGLTAVGSPYAFTITGARNGCSVTMINTVNLTVNPVPAIFTVSGAGGNVCEDATASVSLSGSENGVTYTVLANGSATTAVLNGTGAGLTFAVGGLQPNPSPYTFTVRADNGSCQSVTTTSVQYTIDSLPKQVGVLTAATTICEGSPVQVVITGSQVGVSYRLFRNGVLDPVAPLIGNGGNRAFTINGLTNAGSPYIFTIQATYGTCVKILNATETVSVDAPPTLFNLINTDTTICENGAISIRLSGSQVGGLYRILNGATIVSPTVTGTGGPITLTLNAGLTAPGGTLSSTGSPYTLRVRVNLGVCQVFMNGNFALTVKPIPSVFNVSGTATICSGQNANIALSGSQLGISYQLFNGATPVGAALTGTGSALNFTVSGLAIGGPYTFTVVATQNGCPRNMTGSAAITVSNIPTTFNASGGGAICAGQTATFTLSGSQVGVNYQAMNGATPVGSVVNGTGGALTFNISGLTVGGSPYNLSVMATNASCSATMNGLVNIVVTNFPQVFNVTGGGVACEGQSATITLDGSELGFNYQLKQNGAAIGAAQGGTGSALTFNVTGLTVAGAPYSFTVDAAAGTCSGGMNGAAVFSVNPLPTVSAVGNGSTVCEGDAATVTVPNSLTGTDYQIKDLTTGTLLGSTFAGNNGALTLSVNGLVNANSPYTLGVVASVAGCSADMTGSATVIINSAPIAFAVGGTSPICAGQNATVTLAGSELNVLYQVLDATNTAIGVPQNGTGAGLTFPIGGLTPAGSPYTFTIRATVGSCVRTMTGSATIIVIAPPTAFTVGGGGAFCEGSPINITLTGSQVGVTYDVLNGATVVASLAGSGSALSIPVTLTANVTPYTLTVRATAGTCTNNMSGSAIVSVQPLPTLFNVSGSTTVCQGGSVTVTLSGSQNGATYRLIQNGTAVGGFTNGTGGALTFTVSGLTAAGAPYNFQVEATLGICTQLMNNSAVVAVTPPPLVFNVGGGGPICEGDVANITLDGSENGISYQLLESGAANGAPQIGAGAALTFPVSGLTAAASPYNFTITASFNGCDVPMTGSANVTVSIAPQIFAVSGSATICVGQSATIDLSSSENGVTYQLLNGATPAGAPLAGTGAALQFNVTGLTTTGSPFTFTVDASANGCIKTMGGNAIITVITPPTAFNVGGTSTICEGDPAAITLDGSENGVSYTTLINGVAQGTPSTGTGSPINIPISGLTAAGSPYNVTIQATNGTCQNNMTGSATISVIAAATQFTVGGGGTICQGQTSTVTLNGSQVGLSYQLLNGGAPSGAPVTGTGGALTFTVANLAAGTYTFTVQATTGTCASPMLGSAQVIVNPLPVVFPVAGSGQICEGATANVTLGSSENGYSYQVKDAFNVNFGAAVIGTGNALTFPITGLTVSGSPYTFSVEATSAAGCVKTMSGTATITVNAAPAKFNVSGSSVCEGQLATIAVASSQAGVSYQLIDNNGSPFGAPLAGGSTPLTFQLNTPAPLSAAGSPYKFTVRATNALTCTSVMLDTATVTVSPVPTPLQASGSTVCEGKPAIVTLAGSQNGVTYTVFNQATNTQAAGPTAGTGSALTFTITGLAIGNYNFEVRADINGCTKVMNGPAVVSVQQAPQVFNAGGGGTVCQGAPVTITLSGSQNAISYQLQDVTSGTPVNQGAAQAGTGAGLTFTVNGLAAGTYVYEVRAIAGNCDTVMNSQINVVVTAQPTVFNVSGGNFCEGNPAVITISGSQDNVSYQAIDASNANFGAPVIGNSSNATTTIDVTGLTVAGSPYAFTVVATLNGCTIPMAGTANIIIEPQPLSFAFSGDNICEGENATVVLSSSENGVTYQPLIAGAGVSTPQTSTANGQVLTFSIPGLTAAASPITVQMQATRSNCNVVMTPTQTIIVEPKPAVFALNPLPSATFCQGQTVTLELAGSETDVFYQLLNATAGTPIGAAIGGSGGTMTFTVNGLTGGTYDFEMQATKALSGCRDTISSTSVTIIALPISYPGTVGDNTLCESDNTDLTLFNSQTGVTYQVKDQNGNNIGAAQTGTDGQQLVFPINGLTAGGSPYTLTVEATVANQCSTLMNVTQVIAVTPKPVQFPVSLDATTFVDQKEYCEGDAVVITLNGSEASVFYNVYLVNAVVASFTGDGNPHQFTLNNLAGSATGVQYNFTIVANSILCTDSMANDVTATIYRRPNTPLLGGPDQICEEDNGKVTVTNSQLGYTYQAVTVPGGTPVGIPQPGNGGVLILPIAGLTAANSPYTFSVIAFVGPCTTSTTVASQISVKKRPQVSIAPDPTICVGQTATFTADESGQWYGLVSGILVSLNTNPTNSVILTANVVGFDSVVFFNGNCYDTLAYEVVEQPEFLVDYSGGVCIGSTKTLTSNIPVNWTLFYNGAVTPLGANTASVTADFPTEGVASILIQANGCENTMTIPVQKPFDVFIVSSDADQTICAGTEVTFTATGPDNVIYNFFVNGTSVQRTSFKTFTTSNLTDGAQIFVRGEDNQGCLVPSDTLTFAVEQVPVADFTSDPAAGVPIPLPQATINFTNTSSSSNSFFWTFGDGTSSFEENPIHTFATADTFRVRLIATNSECSDTTEKVYIIKEVPPAIVFADAFTPNGDDRNNLFEIKYYGVETYRIVMYNHKGNLVFDNNSDMTNFWDGTHNGVPCQEGVYFYYCYGNYKTTDNYGSKIQFEFKGTVTLLR